MSAGLDAIFHYLILPLPWMAAAAVIGWQPRRNLGDALLFAAATLVADQAERGVGAQALLCMALPVYALTRRPRFAVVTGAALLGIVLVAALLKKRYAGSALTLQDVQFFFLQFRANLGVAASQPTLMLQAAAVLIALAAVGGLCWRIDRTAAGAAAPHRLLPLGCALLVALSGYDVLAQAGELRERGVLTVGNVPLAEGLAFPLTRFLATSAMQPVWQPPVTDTAAFRALAAPRIGTRGGGGPPADIVVFLQESQFNPATIEGCPAALCELPAFGARPQTRAHGPLKVPVFASGTWLAEFAVLTGVPHQAFGPSGEFVPFNVAQGVRRSFVRSLKAAGYRTVAVYPVRGGMMNARSAYAGYGFDRFVDSDDAGLSGGYHTPDAEIHGAALRVLADERRHGQPVFLFVVTIFNHGEHGIRMARVPGELLAQARAHFPVAREADNVADYVWRTREFERVLATTRSAVLQPQRPAVLAWFGDHLPAFANAPGVLSRIRSVAGTDMPALFQTWYDVSSNVDRLPARTATRAMDLLFLPGLLAEAAGVPLDAWLAANVTAREGCGPAGLDACASPALRDAYLTHLARDLQAFDLP